MLRPLNLRTLFSVFALATGLLLAPLATAPVARADVVVPAVGGVPAVSLQKAETRGGWRAVAAKVVWGGAAGKAVKANKTTTVTLAALPDSNASSAWVVQVQISGAAAAGKFELWTAGKSRPGGQVSSFGKGNSSFTTLVQVAAGRKVSLRTSVAANVSISSVAYLAGSASAQPGPGGSKVVPGFRWIDSTAKVGLTAPKKGAQANPKVTGKGGVPSSGVRAVWLSVQTVGSATGSLKFSRSDGAAGDGVALVRKNAWSTSLVLAPVNANGRIRLEPTVTVKSLRISVVGWMAESSATAAQSTANGSVVPIAPVAVSHAATGTREDVRTAKVIAGSVPKQAGQVLLRANVQTTSAGRVKTSATASQVAAGGNPATYLPANAVSTVVLSAKVDASGNSYVLLPAGAKLSGLTVIGWMSQAVSAAKDAVAPTLTFTKVPNGVINWRKSPKVTLSGTVSDVDSGVKYVAVYASGTLVGTAAVNTTADPAKWTLTASIPKTTKALRAVAFDNAGNKADVLQSVSLILPGVVYTFGSTVYGQSGDGTFDDSYGPRIVPGLNGVVAVTAGNLSNYVVKSDGSVWAWGYNTFGALGDGVSSHGHECDWDIDSGLALDCSPSPVKVANLTGAVAVAAGQYFACAVKSDGTVWCWGVNDDGQLGRGTVSTSEPIPGQVVGLSGVKALAAKESTVYALKSDGTVWAWGYGGYNTSALLGDGKACHEAPNGCQYDNYSSTPVKVANLSGITAIDQGLALKSDGTVWEWGCAGVACDFHPYRQLLTKPAKVAGLSNIKAIAVSASTDTGYALKKDGTVWGWGQAPVGDGTKTNRKKPVKVSGLSKIVSLSRGPFAVKSDGSVYGWSEKGGTKLVKVLTKLSQVQYVTASSDYTYHSGIVLVK
jgi:alpha-tubulin suppressor-like RCC1 family protein